MSFQDDTYVEESLDHPGSLSDTPAIGQSSHSRAGDRAVRRRSSKACDQCRKSKCKCERSGDGEACRSCIMLGTSCTFEGPSRKRGPPKGYIDKIEARLHQTEALLAIISGDSRATSLFDDLKSDPLAKEIINHVDNSPYGYRGRKRSDVEQSRLGSETTSHHPQPKTKHEAEQNSKYSSTHPSNEWQDRISTMLRATTNTRAHPQDASDSLLSLRHIGSSTRQTGERSILRVAVSTSPSGGSSPSPSRRQRRRMDKGLSHELSLDSESTPAFTGSRTHRESSARLPLPPLSLARRSSSERRDTDSDSDSGAERDFNDAVGQLSLNEHEEVRYHGRASGLQMLGHEAASDGRNKGGIWRFPAARVWPPLPEDKHKHRITLLPEDEYASRLPDQDTQKHLIDVYFAHVHPSFPVLHKAAFFEIYRNGELGQESPSSAVSDGTSHSSIFNLRRRRLPTFLLLAMFAIAARYSTTQDSLPPTDGSMWDAGDSYLDSARDILNENYANSKPSTCQALLLMGYREVGIGAMAQAWIYIGMAVRMAQDLGMHRSADGWARAGLGGRLFSDTELQERKRIWYACIIMDKYVSSYIGRPLAIFDGDFDTPLPSEEDLEELEPWQPRISDFEGGHGWECKHPTEATPTLPVPGRVISCFNASARLSCILSTIIQSIYPTRVASSRQKEKNVLETLLDQWYLDLPEHLRFEPRSCKPPVPPPNVLTLHMQYWCTVLLLHRPFIGSMGRMRKKQPSVPPTPPDNEERALTTKSHELCAAAANHISSIATIYNDNFCLRRAPVFLCYYIFSASIAHVTTLTAYPSDPQARIGLLKCLDALRRMDIVWSSAGRAIGVLRESSVNLEELDMEIFTSQGGRNKRSAAQAMDAEESNEDRRLSTAGPSYLPARSQPLGSVGGYQEGYSESLHLPQGMSHGNPSYIPAYERWSPENSSGNAQYPNTLSTSVLPQLYSTGLVDERTSHGIHRSHSTSIIQNQNQSHTRFPQYWNDYSTFPQLGTTYGLSDSIPSAHHPPSQNAPSNMYVNGHYNIYNNHIPNPL